MDPQFSVLLYSKYSPLSEKILDIIRSSPVNLEQVVSLQTLCIDNEKIRKRIYQNKQIDITSVPSILVIFPDGVIEKYDGVSVFQWIEEILHKFTPPPQPQQPPPPQKSLQQLQLEEQQKQKIIQQKQKKLVKSQREQERLKQKKKYEHYLNKNNQVSEEIENSYTNIDDLDSEEDEIDSENSDEKKNDRYRHRKPIGSIREDSGNYTQDDDLFGGEQPNNRQAKKSAIKQPVDASKKKSIDLMAKAKEMEKDRQESPLPPGHPGRK